MTSRIRRLIAAAVVVLMPPATAAAQQTVTDIIDFLVTNQTVPTADFDRDRRAAEAARDTISRALLVNLTSVPLATSSGGFLYRLNPQLGTVERTTESFGGFFVERALTAGRGRASVGISGYLSAFDRLNDAHLRDGSFITVANQFRDEAVPFDTDALTLRVRSSTMTLFGSVGVTDRLEVGAALPIVHLRVEGQRVNTYFGAPFVQATGTATASGVGDAALRAKYMVLSTATGAVAVAGEVRLPTGDEANLLGTGAVSYRVLGIGSYEAGGLTVNGNAGLVRGGISNELNAAGAVSYAVQPRVTVGAELLIRHVDELGTMTLAAEPHPTKVNVDTLRLTPGETGMTLARAVAGVKWNVSGTLVFTGHVTLPLARRGLTAPLTPAVALEWSF